MKVTVIGTINKDLIMPFNDVPIESFGGIFYDIAFLAQLLPDAQIVPVSRVGEDVISTVRAILDKMPNVSQKGLIESEARNHKVILEYTSPLRREEKALFPFPPLKWADIEGYLDADMIVVNMITGWDLELEVFEKLCAVAGERVYLDLHYLATTVDSLGRRMPNMPAHLERWLTGPRFIQMNEDEYKVVGGAFKSEKEFFHAYFKEEQVLLVTKANKGATLVYQKEGITGLRDFPAYRILHVVDTTGCGDAFGAGFVQSYLENEDLLEAVPNANLVAAANATLRGTNEVHRLQEMIQKIRQFNKIKS